MKEEGFLAALGRPPLLREEGRGSVGPRSFGRQASEKVCRKRFLAALGTILSLWDELAAFIHAASRQGASEMGWHPPMCFTKEFVSSRTHRLKAFFSEAFFECFFH